MDYYKFEFQTSPENSEMLLALLSQFPFDSFVENENGIDAFIPFQDYQSGLEGEIDNLNGLFDFSYQKTAIKYKNWNEEWESNFQPILVDDFCGIRADFHEPLTNVQHEIIINPKMAFGTGHHETTWMMIKMMQNLDFSQKNVFDYGCGTGILAILASQLGANKIDAVDIELPSFENTLENSRINNIQNIHAIHGTLENVKDLTYEIVLANINRHVILDSISTLNNMMVESGKLLISGILIEDKELVHQAAENAGFKIQDSIQKNNWICTLLTLD